MEGDNYKQHHKALARRDKNRCQICKSKIKSYYDASIDHILARGLGGGNEISNLQLVHKACNARKNILENKLVNQKPFLKE